MLFHAYISIVKNDIEKENGTCKTMVTSEYTEWSSSQPMYKNNQICLIDLIISRNTIVYLYQNAHSFGDFGDYIGYDVDDNFIRINPYVLSFVFH